jgi:hypothetical protein
MTNKAACIVKKKDSVLHVRHDKITLGSPLEKDLTQKVFPPSVSVPNRSGRLLYTFCFERKLYYDQIAMTFSKKQRKIPFGCATIIFKPSE